MDSLVELRRRRAALRQQIGQQQKDLKKTFLEIREEIEPANLLKNAVSGMFSGAKNKSANSESSTFERLPPSLAFLADLFIKDPRMALLVKLLAPVVMRFIPKQSKNRVVDDGVEIQPTPAKAKLYARLRKSISTFRSSIKRNKTGPETMPPPTEN